jgi:long-chain acyl-CoA synthetase
VFVSGPRVMKEYWRRPDKTAEVLIGGRYHTGDIGHLDDQGPLYIVDRKKDMIISGGFNIYSREVEIFLDSHPAVLESAVIGVPDSKWGEVVKAFIVLKKDRNFPDGQEIVDFCLQKGLSRYKAPKIIRFIEILPKNENGKVIKKDLKGL